MGEWEKGVENSSLPNRTPFHSSTYCLQLTNCFLPLPFLFPWVDGSRMNELTLLRSLFSGSYAKEYKLWVYFFPSKTHFIRSSEWARKGCMRSEVIGMKAKKNGRGARGREKKKHTTAPSLVPVFPISHCHSPIFPAKLENDDDGDRRMGGRTGWPSGCLTRLHLIRTSTRSCSGRGGRRRKKNSLSLFFPNMCSFY